MEIIYLKKTLQTVHVTQKIGWSEYLMLAWSDQGSLDFQRSSGIRMSPANHNVIPPFTVQFAY